MATLAQVSSNRRAGGLRAPVVLPPSAVPSRSGLLALGGRDPGADVFFSSELAAWTGHF